MSGGSGEDKGALIRTRFADQHLGICGKQKNDFLTQKGEVEAVTEHEPVDGVEVCDAPDLVCSLLFFTLSKKLCLTELKF